MVKAYIGLGSNIGDGLRTLVLAGRKIADIEQIQAVSVSSPYRSEPVGMKSDSWFINAVVAIETTHTAEELLAVLQKIEQDFGRIRREQDIGYEDRTLDLDILLFGDTISANPLLMLPHPEMAGRRFVLEPLAEIAPELVHPVYGVTISALKDTLAGQKGQASQKIEKTVWPETII